MRFYWHIILALVHHLAKLATADDQNYIVDYSLYQSLRTCARPCIGGYATSHILYVIGYAAFMEKDGAKLVIIKTNEKANI
jgi:hypothetical protein